MLLTAEEVAAYMGATPQTIRNHVKAGRIRCYMVGPKLMRFDIDEVLEDYRRPPRSGPAGNGAPPKPIVLGPDYDGLPEKHGRLP